MTDSRAATAASLVGRDRALTLARDLLFSASADVDVIGPRRSGRSSMVEAISAFADDTQRTAIRVNGVRSLGTTPLAALHAAGLGATAGQDRRSPSPLQQAIDALTAAVARNDAVILVDDADLLDDASTGAVDAVRRATGVPLLRTRARLAEATESGYVIELTPLSYDELTSAVTRRLGGPVDVTTMSRLYAVAGGNVGVAISTIQLAAVEGALTRRAGIWTAESDLWSPSLRGLALDHLADLAPAERSALEAIAMAADGDAASLRDRGDAAAMDALEAARMVKTVHQRGRRRIVLDPPLLSEHFRRSDATSPAPDALFVRHVHEEADASRAGATAEWHRSPTPRTALALVRALMAPTGMAPGAAAELDAVLTAATGYSGDPVSLIGLAELRARRELGGGQDLETVSAALHAAVCALGEPYSRAADATVALLAVEVGTAPGTGVDRSDDDPALPADVRARLLLAAQAVALQRGRFADALDLHDLLRSLPDTRASPIADALHGLALLGSGRHTETAAWAARGAETARERLDIDALRVHSLVAGLCHLISGRSDDASSAIATATALGAAPVPGSAAEVGLRGLAAVIAARRGDLPCAERIRDELAGGSGAQSPASRAALDWIDAQLAAGRGRSDQAVALLHRLAGRLRSNGQESAAAFALLTALEHTAGEHGLEEARTLIAGQQSELFDAYFAHLVARGQHDHDAQRALAPRLVAVGLERLTIGGGGDTSFFSTPVALTDREREIIRFVADGLVYREIAARLHLSARTVEGIAARIIRKLDLRDRRELAELALSGAL
ncbi:LuxR C-terminal-related transcriptional regulator [Leifsonia sp. McL0607]|uniref:LuxR C-terminal-related transcriptional regulator n=1 Tax=Leifsonia sp. McL0607 TaxID=3415672 RepID=UPI003CEFC646